jgi:AraC-like DNA-binding protein
VHEFSAENLGVQRCGIYSELPALLESYGIEPEPVLQVYGFTRADFADQDRALPFADVVRLVDACATATGDGTFGLVLGLKARTSQLGLIGDMVRNAPTLGRALRNFIENHHRYVRGGAPYVVEQDPYVVRHRDEVLIGYRCMISGLPTLQFLLASVGVGIALVRELCGQSAKDVLLACSSDRLPATEIKALLRPAHVRFDSHHFGITYPKSVIDAPIAGADPARYREATQRVQVYWNGLEPDFVDQIRRLLLPVLMADRAHMRTLCETTGLHPRTINRRLAENGTSLRALVNATRFDIACQLLRHTYLPVAAVAHVMGYSEPGVFVRAFRQWSGGSTPDAWRTRRLALEAETPSAQSA